MVSLCSDGLESDDLNQNYIMIVKMKIIHILTKMMPIWFKSSNLNQTTAKKLHLYPIYGVPVFGWARIGWFELKLHLFRQNENHSHFDENGVSLVQIVQFEPDHIQDALPIRCLWYPCVRFCSNWMI